MTSATRDQVFVLVEGQRDGNEAARASPHRRHLVAGIVWTVDGRRGHRGGVEVSTSAGSPGQPNPCSRIRGSLWDMRVVGVDACKRGWIAVVLQDHSALRGVFAEHLDGLIDEVPDADGFAIDIPIGLPAAGEQTHGRRRADVEARQFLRTRRASVFFTPVRDALTASSHAEATKASMRLTGKGVSQQAFALAPKILQAERWVGHSPVPTWEVHPEVSFALMLGRPARSAKTTWAGMKERVAALEREGIRLGSLGDAGHRAGVDDALDAAAAAWSALRLVRGDGISLPDPPEIDPESGRAVAIWA